MQISVPHTINEGFGTIYDRVWKARILLKLMKKYDLHSITEFDMDVPIIDSGGVGLDILLIHEKFNRIQIACDDKENVRYIKTFLYQQKLKSRLHFISKADYINDDCRITDIFCGSYILEFTPTDDLRELIDVAKCNSKYIVFFESSHQNLGHPLLKILGSRFMIAPWVSCESFMSTNICSCVNKLADMGEKLVDYGMMDFPFFAPTSGISPFKAKRTQRRDFVLEEPSHLKKSLIKTGMGIEKLMPWFVRRQSHMFYVIIKGGLQ